MTRAQDEGYVSIIMIQMVLLVVVGIVMQIRLNLSLRFDLHGVHSR